MLIGIDTVRHALDNEFVPALRKGLENSFTKCYGNNWITEKAGTEFFSLMESYSFSQHLMKNERFASEPFKYMDISALFFVLFPYSKDGTPNKHKGYYDLLREACTLPNSFKEQLFQIRKMRNAVSHYMENSDDQKDSRDDDLIFEEEDIIFDNCVELGWLHSIENVVLTLDEKRGHAFDKYYTELKTEIRKFKEKQATGEEDVDKEIAVLDAVSFFLKDKPDSQVLYWCKAGRKGKTITESPLSLDYVLDYIFHLLSGDGKIRIDENGLAAESGFWALVAKQLNTGKSFSPRTQAEAISALRDEKTQLSQDNAVHIMKGLDQIGSKRNYLIIKCGYPIIADGSCVIPDNTKRIAPGAFKDRKDLTSVVFTISLNSIGNDAFSGTSLKNIEIPSSVISLGKRAFMGCQSLETVEIGGYRSIPEECFCDCKSLQTVTIKNALHYIGTRSFSGCSSIKEFGRQSDDGLLPVDVDIIEESAFFLCTSLEKINIKTKSIGENAFQLCTSLREVELDSANTINIDKTAFDGCDGIQDFRLSKSICETFENSYYNLYNFLKCLPSVPYEGFERIVDRNNETLKECWRDKERKEMEEEALRLERNRILAEEQAAEDRREAVEEKKQQFIMTIVAILITLFIFFIVGPFLRGFLKWFFT